MGLNLKTRILSGIALFKKIRTKDLSKKDKNLSSNSGTQSSDTESVAEFIKRTNAEVKERYDFLTFKTVGLTSKSEREKRQTILRKMKFLEPPFEHAAILTIHPYDLKGEPAYEVYANNEQIGNAPKKKAAYLKKNWNRTGAITAIHIKGGAKNYSAEITIRLNKKCQQVKA
jgi:hypothetical protein